MKSKPKIMFVSYDGEYPCLCRGQLVLKIGRRTYRFGTPFNDCLGELPPGAYPRFWTSGGNVRLFQIEQGKWESDIDGNVAKELPREVLDNIDCIMDLFNSHVPYGCCGGCI